MAKAKGCSVAKEGYLWYATDPKSALKEDQERFKAKLSRDGLELFYEPGDDLFKRINFENIGAIETVVSNRACKYQCEMLLQQWEQACVSFLSKRLLYFAEMETGFTYRRSMT